MTTKLKVTAVTAFFFSNSFLEQGYAYEGYYARNHAHHNFNNSLSHLSFFSFRQHGTVSPAIRPRDQANMTLPNRPEVY